MDYYKVYMQLEADGSDVVETIDDYGLYCMDIPFAVATGAKELTKRDWHDEDGEDVYMPKDGLRLSAYDIDVKFGYRGGRFGANDSINAFLDFVRRGMLKMYCDYTRIGRRHVVFSKLSDKATLVRDIDEGDLLVITATFRVCDPVTNIVPAYDSNGNVSDLQIETE